MPLADALQTSPIVLIFSRPYDSSKSSNIEKTSLSHSTPTSQLARTPGFLSSGSSLFKDRPR